MKNIDANCEWTGWWTSNTKSSEGKTTTTNWTTIWANRRKHDEWWNDNENNSENKNDYNHLHHHHHLNLPFYFQSRSNCNPGESRCHRWWRYHSPIGSHLSSLYDVNDGDWTHYHLVSPVDDVNDCVDDDWNFAMFRHPIYNWRELVNKWNNFFSEWSTLLPFVVDMIELVVRSMG